MLNNRTAQLWSGGALLAMMAGGMFLTGRWLEVSPAVAASHVPNPPQVLPISHVVGANAGAAMQEGVLVQHQFLAAPELPTRPPEAVGFFGARTAEGFTLNAPGLGLPLPGAPETGTIAFSAQGGMGQVWVGGAGPDNVFSITTNAIFTAPLGVVTYTAGGPGLPLPPDVFIAADGPFTLPMGVGGSIIAFGGAGEMPPLPPGVEGGNVFISITADGPLTMPLGVMGVQVMTYTNGELPPGVAGGPTFSINAAPPGLPFPGTPVAVVVTPDTQIYRDATAFDPEQPNATIQQTVAAGTLDDLNAQTMITVWGHMEGDQLVAEVIFYSNPVIINHTMP